jgi:hypothetical protein
MIHADYEAVKQDLLAEAAGIETAKRPGYTNESADVLANFKHVAADMGISAQQAWGVYFLKHISAIVTQARNPGAPQAEAIKGRYADAINYLKLGYALVVEEAKVDALNAQLAQLSERLDAKIDEMNKEFSALAMP